MLIFISTFTIFTFINIFFENIKISFFVFSIVFIVLLFYLLVKFRKFFYKKWKYFFILTISFIVSILAIIIKTLTYDQNLFNKFFDLEIENINNSSWLNYFIWSWIITDTYSSNKYIFQLANWSKYILDSKKSYQIQDQLRLVWYQKNVDISSNKNSSWIFNREFDYNKRLIMKWFYGNIYEQNSIDLSQKNKIASSFYSSQWLWYIKRNLQSKIISIYWNSRNAGLILWMLIWDKSQIPKPDYQNFIDSGLVHIIAVSGGNIIMIVIFLSIVLFFLPFYFKNFVIFLVVILYSLVCWMDSSVFRAVLFAWMTMMALFMGKENNFRRSVWIVYIVMLLYNPYFLLYDLGFLLSFWAVIGIKIFSSLKDQWSKIQDNKMKTRFCLQYLRPEWLVRKVYNNYIKPSLWANIWIFPIIIFFMWKINLIWFLSNLFVLPIVPILMIYWFFSIFLYQIFPYQIILDIQIVLTNYVFAISELTWNYWIYLLVDSPLIKYMVLSLFIILLVIHIAKINKSTSKTTKTKNIIKTWF